MLPIHDHKISILEIRIMQQFFATYNISLIQAFSYLKTVLFYYKTGKKNLFLFAESEVLTFFNDI